MCALPHFTPLYVPAPPLQTLSELQKENSGLRAACVTLGRELLSLKSEFTEFQQRTTAALAALGPSAATQLSAGAGIRAGASAFFPQQQQQAQQVAAAAVGPQASGSGEPAGGMPALPSHMPAAAAVAQAAMPPALPFPAGHILLVGGHDSGSWLESVGERGSGEPVRLPCAECAV